VELILWKKIFAIFISFLFIGSTFGIASIFGATGGPDEFGYTYDDTVPYQWIDISETGTDSEIESYDRAKVPIGFDFKFYGNTYEEVWISSSGFLQFGSEGGDEDYDNQDIPVDDDLNNIICPFWDDISLREKEEAIIYYQSFPDKFIVQWVEFQHDNELGNPESKLTFQVILYKDSNDIKFQYKEMVNDNYYYADGRSATIGIENIDGTIGLKYFFGEYNEVNNPYAPPGPIKDNLAILFTTGTVTSKKSLPMYSFMKLLGLGKFKE